jgi:thiamine biosynthesis lipoprotein
MTSAADRGTVMKIQQPVIVSLILISLLIAGCSRSDSPDVLEFSGHSMGTWYSVKVVELPADIQPEQVAEAIESQLDNVNGKMSTYKSDSELSRFNQTALNTPFQVSQDTFFVLRKALEIWRLSQGAFDISVGPLVNLWGFGPDGRPQQVPTQKEMQAAWDRVGSDRLILHMDDFAIEKSRDLYIDLSAIAKGYAADRVAEALEGLGVRRYLVEVGGEIRAGNSKAHHVSWQVAVEEPVSSLRKIHKVIKLDNASMATSGDYRNYFEYDGRRYSHTIDPRNGQPINHRLVSTSVIMPQCADADAWATAIMVLGPDQGMEVAEANNLPVYMILKSGQGFETRHSSAFIDYLVP